LRSYQDYFVSHVNDLVENKQWLDVPQLNSQERLRNAQEAVAGLKSSIERRHGATRGDRLWAQAREVFGTTSVAPQKSISEFRNEVLLFMGDQVIKNMSDFRRALEQMDETQMAVVLAANEVQRTAIIDQTSERTYRAKLIIVTGQEAGLPAGFVNKAIRESGYSIRGMENIIFAPMSEMKQQYSEFRESNIGI
ncbi:MAG: hypothetical protein ABH815_00345, partial [Candidatus Omnitrophota bacterium]